MLDLGISRTEHGTLVSQDATVVVEEHGHIYENLRTGIGRTSYSSDNILGIWGPNSVLNSERYENVFGESGVNHLLEAEASCEE